METEKRDIDEVEDFVANMHQAAQLPAFAGVCLAIAGCYGGIAGWVRKHWSKTFAESKVHSVPLPPTNMVFLFQGTPCLVGLVPR